MKTTNPDPGESYSRIPQILDQAGKEMLPGSKMSWRTQGTGQERRETGTGSATFLGSNVRSQLTQVDETKLGAGSSSTRKFVQVIRSQINAAMRWQRANSITPTWLPERWRRTQTGYALALLGQVLATLLTAFFLEAVPGFRFVGAFSLFGIVLAAVVFGAGPSLFATVTGALLLFSLVLPPQFSLAPDTARQVPGILLYLVLGATLSVLPGQRAQARQTADRAEKEAAARSALLETTFGAMTDGMAVYDPSGRIMLANTAYDSMFEKVSGSENLSETLAERATRTPMLDRQGNQLPPEGWPPARILAGVTLSGPSAADVAVDTPGGRLYFRMTGTPMRDSDGSITGAVVVAHDITERQRMEREATEQARELEATFEALPDSLALFDAEGRVLRQNAASRALTALYHTDDLVDLPAEKRWQRVASHALDGTALTIEQTPLVRVLHGESLTGPTAQVLYQVALDGSRRYYSYTGRPLDDPAGEIVGAVLTTRDITEERRLERQTQETLEALIAIIQALVGASEDAELAAPVNLGRHIAELVHRILPLRYATLFTLSPGTELLAVVAVAGLSPEQEEVLRRDTVAQSWRNIPLPQAEQRLLQRGETLVFDLTTPPFAEWRSLFSADLAVIVPMRVGERFIGMLAMSPQAGLTLSARELALAEGLAQMAALIMERDRLLREREAARALVLALAETDRRRDEFLSIASHELRTPVTVISTNIQMAGMQLHGLGRTAPQDLPEDRHTRLTRAELLLNRTGRQLVRLNRLIDDLLDTVRVQQGRFELRQEPCDLAVILRDATQEQRATWPGREVVLNVTQQQVIPIIADADRIGQVVTNLLSNALKYSPPDTPVVVRMVRQGEVMRVEVCDQGPGLTDEQKERVFERYYRAPGIEQQSGSNVGLGIGLYIAKMIIELHGGGIGVESVPDEGSCFWFQISGADSRPESASE